MIGLSLMSIILVVNILVHASKNPKLYVRKVSLLY